MAATNDATTVYDAETVYDAATTEIDDAATEYDAETVYDANSDCKFRSHSDPYSESDRSAANGHDAGTEDISGGSV